jgi:hypothetical protein
MAHCITATDHMVSGNNTTPWHGLGTVLPGNISACEALSAARLKTALGQQWFDFSSQ